MGVGNDYLCWVLEQLSGAGRISSKRMFGAVGLYRDGIFFGIVSGDTLYLKAGDANRRDFEERGMPPFRPYRDKPQVSMSYYEVPADVLEDPDECAAWALRAVAAGAARDAGPRPRARRRKPNAARR